MVTAMKAFWANISTESVDKRMLQGLGTEGEEKAR
jgi:hypothetical protein